MRHTPLLRLAAITPLLLGLAPVAHAQTVPPQPLIVERIRTGSPSRVRPAIAPSPPPTRFAAR